MHGNGLRWCLAALLGLSAISASTGQSGVAARQHVDHPRVRIVYLVPTDGTLRRDYVKALSEAAESAQTWFAVQLSGSSFRLSKPVVDVVLTTHPAGWYSSNPVAGTEQWLWFWYNALEDAFALTGGRFDDPANRWLYYVDADPACGEATGGTAGVALFPANDLRGLVGEANVPVCPYDPPDNGGVCRWVGGLGHELGHALLLPHPSPCPGGADDGALMCLGYITYPSTYLLETDRSALDSSPFFAPARVPKQTKTLLCGPF